jgi:CTP:molybdopterin cytidylyltransferase MocA
VDDPGLTRGVATSARHLRPEVNVSTAVPNDVAAIVLAAGQGTRFKSDVGKVLHRAAGRSLIRHVLESLRPLGLGQIVVVVGHQADDVRAEIEASGIAGVTTVLQAEQRGTGHAVQQAMPALDDGIRRVFVLPGDTPLLTPQTLGLILEGGAKGEAVLAVTQLDDPTGYGRVLRDAAGTVTAVVEHRDATPEQRDVQEINAGLYLVARELLDACLHRLDDDSLAQRQSDARSVDIILSVQPVEDLENALVLGWIDPDPRVFPPHAEEREKVPFPAPDLHYLGTSQPMALDHIAEAHALHYVDGSRALT